MSKTRHVQPKTNRAEMELVIGGLLATYGVLDANGFSPRDEASMDALINRLANIEKTAMKVLDKGGIVVVSKAGVEITTYNLTSFKRKRH